MPDTPSCHNPWERGERDRNKMDVFKIIIIHSFKFCDRHNEMIVQSKILLWSFMLQRWYEETQLVSTTNQRNMFKLEYTWSIQVEMSDSRYMAATGI